MTKNIDTYGLRSIIENYDLFFIDLWGVLHNGIKLHKEAVNVLIKISESKKDYVLLTNAPRPKKSVENFLEKMGLEEAIRRKVFTSGEAALSYLKKNHFKDRFFHIGPPRDSDLFIDFKERKADNILNSEYLLCTGWYDEHS